MITPILDVVENNAVDLSNDILNQALHLIITTLYTPKGLIPNMPDVGCSVYDKLSTLNMETFNLQVFNNDLQVTGMNLGYDVEAIQVAMGMVKSIDIQDQYLYTTYDAYNNPQYFVYEILEDNNIQSSNVEIVKTVTITLDFGLALNLILR